MNTFSLWAVIAIGLASNLDNAGVGIAYGARKIHIPWYSNLAIALISFLATLLSGLFGNWIAIWIHPWIGQWIGTIVIVAVGVWVLLQPFVEKKAAIPPENDPPILTRLLRNPEEADRDSSKSLSLGESLLLGIALAMNALAGGFNAGITHLNVFYTSLSVGVFSYLLLALCAGFGEKYAAEKLGNRATVISGLLLILIGLHQIL
ncbi:putative sporulation protein YtaF [Fontibacillus phaseoli]|uniref:Putative sporulation protein YtaF n=1 Tax=Fontibacillus phaseoli TaxID=1416533 RepID=A0A369BIZ2_9BACL|nr:sporulation membrane protein YtaF [Fontibacillus phaseoli]RCX20546.1 putative sporulation protein YtaF [Fontibacillus phaseoli]